MTDRRRRTDADRGRAAQRLEDFAAADRRPGRELPARAAGDRRARATAARASRCCCSRSARSCSPAPGSAPSVDFTPARRVPARRRPRPRPRRACGCGWPSCSTSVDTYSYVFDPYDPRDGRQPAVRRPDQHRHRPRERPAPLPRRQRRRGAVVVAVLLRLLLGQPRPAPCSRAAVGRRPRPARRGVRRASSDQVAAADEMLDAAPDERPGRLGGRRRAASARDRVGTAPDRARGRAVGIVVQKYGGSSRRRRRRHQAGRPAHRRHPEGRPRRRRRRLRDGRHHRRAARPRRAGHARCRRRASSTCCSPPASGSRWRCSRWRSPTSATTARSFTGSPGRRDHRLGARQGQDHRRHAGPDRAGARRAARSRSWPASRASARTPRTSPRSAAAAPTPPRSRWPRRSAPRSARSTPTSTASSPPTRGSCRPPASSTGSPTRRCSRWRPAGAKILHLRCVEYARRYDIPIHVRSSFSQKEGTWIAARPTEGADDMEQAIIAGVAHDRSEAKITVVGVPDKVGEAARIFEALADGRGQPRHDRAERLGRGHRPHRHLVHAAARRRPDRDGGAGRGSRTRSATTRCSTTTRSARSR